jgi:hypothetical protein
MALWPNFVTAASSSLRCTGSSSTMRMEPVMTDLSCLPGKSPWIILAQGSKQGFKKPGE